MPPRSFAETRDQHAKSAVAEFRGGSAIGAAVGALWLILIWIFPDHPIIFAAAIYFSSLCGVGSIICLAAALYTKALSSVEMDIALMESGLRRLESDRRSRANLDVI